MFMPIHFESGSSGSLHPTSLMASESSGEPVSSPRISVLRGLPPLPIRQLAGRADPVAVGDLPEEQKRGRGRVHTSHRLFHVSFHDAPW
jgi:hypothetical protein